MANMSTQSEISSLQNRKKGDTCNMSLVKQTETSKQVI